MTGFVNEAEEFTGQISIFYMAYSYISDRILFRVHGQEHTATYEV